MSEDKAALRRVLRQNPPMGDSLALCRRVLEHPWFLAARAVMAFAAIPPEPELDPVLEAALAAGKTLLLPRCGDHGAMTAHGVSDLSELETGAYGIREPAAEVPEFPPEEIQLILVPGMAFSPAGGRLGRGKGYYDRFLTGTAAKTIGICFEEALLQHVPMDGYDHRVDAVITDKQTILCGMEGDACLERSAN